MVRSESAEMYTITSVVRRRQRKSPPALKSPNDVYVLMRDRMKGFDKEHFYAAMLNTKNQLIALELISIGSLNASIVHPREVLKPAILASAATIILIHNHPTGDTAPSREDVEFTQRFAKCGELIGIELLDHIIIGDGSYHSLKEHGTF